VYSLVKKLKPANAAKGDCSAATPSSVRATERRESGLERFR
jgi:hypothetical protein